MTDFPEHPDAVEERKLDAEMLAREHAEALTPFWVGWYGIGGFEYHGPWWISGYASGQRVTYCAAVMAADEEAARKVILTAYDDAEPDVEFRFAEERDQAWSPYSDRFGQAGWMRWPWPGAIVDA